MMLLNSLRSISVAILLSALATSACQESKKQSSETDPDPTNSGPTNPGPTDPDPSNPEPAFSMTVPQEDRIKSNYCGQVTPPKPEDPTPAYQFDPQFIDEKLKGEGLTGWIHGIVPSYGHYTFTYRKEDPDDFMAFFKAQQFIMIPMTPEMRGLLPKLNRHDKVRLHGSFFENGSPLPHLKVTGLEVITPYPHVIENEYNFDFATLKGQKTVEVFGQVHATVHSEKLGYGIVLEYKDAMIPIAVSAQHASVAENLYRGDILNVHLEVFETPHSPPHFRTNIEVAEAIEVVDPMLNCHNQERTVEGILFKFRQSPAISSDTYGVRVVDENGIARNFTLFPGDHGDGMIQLFKDLAKKASTAWDASPEQPIVVRNFHMKPSLRVKATGVLNAESKEQANPQVYISKIEDLVIIPSTEQ